MGVRRDGVRMLFASARGGLRRQWVQPGSGQQGYSIGYTTGYGPFGLPTAPGNLSVFTDANPVPSAPQNLTILTEAPPAVMLSAAGLVVPFAAEDFDLIHDFTAANQTTMPAASTGQVAQVDGGDAWGIVDNKAYCVTGADNRYVSWNLGSIRQYAEFVCEAPGTDKFPALMVRYTSATSHYRVEVNPAGPLQLIAVKAGVGTVLQGSGTQLAAAGDRIGLEVDEVFDSGVTKTQLRVFRNDVQVMAVFDTASPILTGTRVGFRNGVGAAPVSPLRFDRLRAKVGSQEAPPAPPALLQVSAARLDLP